MPGNTRRPRRLITRAVAVAALIAAGLVMGPARAEDKPPEVVNSDLDSTLFYQLLIGEIELSAGRAGNAFEVMLDAARREGDDALYQRAVDIALQARAGDQALAAAQAWRAAKPQSVAALRYQMQILMALNRPVDAMEPMGVWLALAPVMERSGLIAGLPRLLARMPDKRHALSLADALLAQLQTSASGATSPADTLLAQARSLAG